MTTSSLPRRRSKLAAYAALMKPRVMSLAIFTAVVGLVLAPSALSPLRAAIAVTCIALGAGAAGVLNMWYDRDIDRLMGRTAARPLPTGQVAPAGAAVFGVSLAAVSVGVLGWATNWLAAGLLALTVAYYIGVYTAWLKRRTPQSVVIGGVAGALPPVIGWSAAAGSIDPVALVLFAMIFLWTPPHSWALALFKGRDFAQADLPNMDEPGARRAITRQIVAYAGALFPVSLAPSFLGAAGPGYIGFAAVLSAAFLLGAWRLMRAGAEQTSRQAGALFGYSIVYLFLLFAALLIDHSLALLV